MGRESADQHGLLSVILPQQQLPVGAPKGGLLRVGCWCRKQGAGAGAAEGGRSLGSAGSWLAAHQVAAYCFAAVLHAFVASLAYAVCLPGPGPGPGSAAADIELQREVGGATATAGEGPAGCCPRLPLRRAPSLE